MTTIQTVQKIVREASDVESKLAAAVAGGITVGGVTTLLNAVGITDAPTWLVLAITLVATFVVGYFKKSVVTVSSSDGSTVAVDVNKEVTAALPSSADANIDLSKIATHIVDATGAIAAVVGAAESEQSGTVAAAPVADDAAGKHAAA